MLSPGSTRYSADYVGAARRWLDRLRRESFWPGFLPTHTFTEDWVDPHPGLAADDYAAIRMKAAAFIVRLAPAEGEQNPEPAEVRRTASFPLEATAYEHRELEDCLTALRTGTIEQQRQAADAMALRDPAEAHAACPLLTDLLDLPQVRMVAFRALANLGSGAAPAMPKIGELLDHDDAFVRVGATYVLTRIGPDAFDMLARCKNDHNFTIAHLATETLDGWEKAE